MSNPNVTSVSPHNVPLNQEATVTIQGTNLTNASAVYFGTVQATILTNTNTEITVTVPSQNTSNAVNVIVTTSSGANTAGYNNAFVFGLSDTPNPNTWLTMTPTGRWNANALCADLDGKIIALAATSTGTVWLNTDVENVQNVWVDITSRLVTGQVWQATAMCFNGGNNKVSAILCSSNTTGVVYFAQDITSPDSWVNLTANGSGIQGLTVGLYAAVSLCYNSIGLTAVVRTKINHDLNTSTSGWTTINSLTSISRCSSLVVFNNALACAIGIGSALYYSPDIINDTNMTKVFEYIGSTDIIKTVGLAYGKSGTLSAMIGKSTDFNSSGNSVQLTLDINLPTPTWTILTAGSSSGNTNLPTTLGSPFSSLITDTFGNINSIMTGLGEVYYNPIVTSSTSSWVTLTNAGAGYRNLPQTLTGNGPVSLYNTSTSGMKSLVGVFATSGNMYLNQNLNLVSVSSISPTTGPSGVTIQVTGTNFNDCSSVTFGSTDVTGSSITPTSLVVVSPSGDTGTTSHLQVNTPVAQSVQTPSDVYTYADVPVISGISPSSGYLAGGYQVTISGSNFTSSPTVTFGGLNGTNITVSGTTSITVTVPGGSALGAVTVVVTCNGLTSIPANVGSNQFTYLANPVPTISDISPRYLPGNGFNPAAFTVTGTNFTANSVIKYIDSGNTERTIIPDSVTSTTLVCNSGIIESNGEFRVYDTVFNTTSNNFLVYLIYAPNDTICNLSPSSGSTGTSVTLTGDIVRLEGDIVIHFGSTTIDQFLEWNPTRTTTTFLVPDLPPGSYNVYYTNLYGSLYPSLSTTFSIVDQPPGQPTVSSVTANRGSATVAFIPVGPLATDYTITATPGGATGNVLYPLTSGAVTSLGSPSGTPYTFTVTPRNSAGNGPPSAASNSTTVYSNPTSVSLVPSATTMTDGTQLTMTPTFTNATTANIKYGSQQVNVISGSGNPYTIPSPPTNTTTVYTLEVSNAGYTATPYATTSVISVPAPSITAFSAIPSQSITVGDSLSLTGTFTGGTGTVSTTGGYSQTITSGLALAVPSPAQTTTYNLAVTNSAGATATATPLTVNVYPAPSISTFTSTPSQGITIGESVPLRLNTTFTGGTGIISTTTGYSSSITSGTPLTVTPRPVETTTYSLVVTNSAGATATATPLTVNVYPAPSISTFTSTPSQGITIGESVPLRLNTTFTGGTGIISTTTGYSSSITSGTPLTVTPRPVETTTYSLVVTNSIGATATVTPLTVNVYPVPTISNFTMSPTIITVGDSVAVNATVTGSTNTEILYGPVGSSPSSIPYASIIYPTTSGNYQLRASNQLDYQVLSSNIFDISVNGPPSISSFTADPLQITVGGSSTLRATFSNGSATYSTNGGTFQTFTSGTSVNPTQNSTYVLRVTNLAEDTIDSSPVTVTVYSLPTGSLSKSTVTNNTVVLTPSFPSPNTGSINNNVGTVTSGVTYPVQIFNTTTYTLTVSNPLGVTQIYSQKVTIPLTRVSLGNQKFSVVSNPLQTIFTPILPVVIQGGTVNKTYSMTAPSGSKPTLGINPSTGVVTITSISGVIVGDYTYTVTVTDGDNQTLSDLPFVITVLSAPSTYTSYSKFTGANYNDLSDLQKAGVVNAIGQQILAANSSTTVQYIDLSSGSVGATAGTTTVAAIPESTISVYGITITNIVCFLQTCNIKMLDGTYRNIQDIVNGDVLLSALTGTGIRVTHCGYNTVSDLSRLHSTNHPMRIPRDFFGEGSPAHDVFMSGHHRLFFSINGHALGLQAFKVVGMENVLTMEEALRVTNSTELRYYHVEVEGGKNAVFCDGLPVETLDSDEWDEGRCVENK